MVVRVGDRVLVEGTSKWWPGGNYLAVVADVGLDGSVKVRYADGGFKRFSRADFERLSTPAQAHHEALEEADSAAGVSPCATWLWYRNKSDLCMSLCRYAASQWSARSPAGPAAAPRGVSRIASR